MTAAGAQQIPDSCIRALRQLLLIRARLPDSAFRAKRDEILKRLLAEHPPHVAAESITALQEASEDLLGPGAANLLSDDEATEWLLRTVDASAGGSDAVPLTDPASALTSPLHDPKPGNAASSSAAAVDPEKAEALWSTATEDSELRGRMVCALGQHIMGSHGTVSEALLASLHRVVAQLGELDRATVRGCMELVRLDEEQAGDLLESFVKPFGLLEQQDLDTLKQMAVELAHLPVLLRRAQEEAELEAKRRELAGGWVHLWGTEAEQMCIVPHSDGRPPHFFLYLEADQEAEDVQAAETGAAMTRQSEATILVYWDISQSMNNMENGRMHPAESPDDPASNMRKARELVPDLALNALRRGCDLQIVPWNHMCPAEIRPEFNPNTFAEVGHQVGAIHLAASAFLRADEETPGGVLDEEKLLAEVARKVSEHEFRAGGATCIEAALQHMRREVRAASAASRKVVVWFLTDGEETIYLQSADKQPLACKPEVTAAEIEVALQDRKHLLRKPKQAKNLPEFFDFFGARDSENLTLYQRSWAERILEPMLAEAATQESTCELEVHFVGFGEAEATTLHFLSASLGGAGLFHSVAELASLQDELRATQATTGLELSLRGSGGVSQVVRGAFSERLRAIVCRGQLSPELAGEIEQQQPRLSISAPFLRRQRQLACVQLHSGSSMPRHAGEAMELCLGLEGTLAAQLDVILEGEVAQEELAQLSAGLRVARGERQHALVMAAQHIRPPKGILSTFMQEALRGSQLTLEGLERQLRQHFVAEGHEYESGRRRTGHGAEYWQRRQADGDAARTGLRSLRMQLGSGISQDRFDARVAQITAAKGALAKRMLSRRCLLAEDVLKPEGADDAEGEVLLMLLILEASQWEEVRRRALRELATRRSPEALALLVEAFESGSMRFAKYSERLCHDLARVREGRSQWESLELQLECTLMASGGPLTLEGRVQAAQLYEETQAAETADQQPDSIEGHDGTQGDMHPGKRFYRERYWTRVAWIDLHEAKKEYQDPFSLEDFVDLIRGSGTLPAFLYTVNSTLQPGLLYDGKELLHVLSAGSAADRASFESYRLFYDSARQDNDAEGLVQFPGTLCRSNFALPIAPEPLSNKVLAHMLPGQLGSFITGTPTALLSDVIHFYLGFVMMHLRPAQFRVHPDEREAARAGAAEGGCLGGSLEVLHMLRAAQLLCTVGCWLDDRHSLPERWSVDVLLDDALSEGRFPLKTSKMRLLTGSSNPRACGRYRAKGAVMGRRPRFERVGDSKVEMVYDDAASRWSVLVEGQAVHHSEGKDERPPEGNWPAEDGAGPSATVREIQPAPSSPGKTIPVRGFCYALLDDRQERGVPGALSLVERFCLVRDTVLFRSLSNIFTAERDSQMRMDVKAWLVGVLDQLAGEDAAPPAIPEKRVEVAQRLHAAVEGTAGESDEFLLAPGHREVLLKAVRQLLLQDLGQRLAKAPWWHWWVQMRLLYQFFLLGSHGMHALRSTFRAFAPPKDFEAHTQRVRAAVADLDWQQVLWMAMPEDGRVLLVLEDGSSLEVKRAGGAVVKRGPWEDPRVGQLVRELFCAVASHYGWKGRASNCFWLDSVDYDVARALLGEVSADTLDSSQQESFRQACAWKNLEYAQWNRMTERPSLPVDIDVGDSSVRINICDAPRRMDEAKTRLSFVLLGEKDSGKSSAAGRLICGTQSSTSDAEVGKLAQLAQKYNKEGSEWAWVLDRLREERERSSTITAKSWNIHTPRHELDLLDAPGERSFMSNLLHGAALADAAVLVVSASAGEFERGMQRGDHKSGTIQGMTQAEPELAYAMGIRELIVVVNKMDHPSVRWSQGRFDEVVAQVKHVLKRTKRYFESACFIPIAALPGHNITTRYAGEDGAWFNGFTFHGVQGHTLADALDALPARPQPPANAPLCMPISEIIDTSKMRGVGTIVSGVLLQGQLQVGSHLSINGKGRTLDTVVKSMEAYHTQCDLARPGDRVALQLRHAQGIREVERGSVAGPVKGSPQVVQARAIRAQVQMLQVPNPIKVGCNAVMYCHMARFQVRFAALLWRVGKDTGGNRVEEPQGLGGHDVGEAIIEFIGPCQPVSCFAELPELGRFVLAQGGMGGLEAMTVGKVMETFREGTAPGSCKRGSASSTAPPGRLLGPRRR